MNREERWALNLLSERGSVALGQAAIAPGAPDRDDVLDALTALERARLAEYNPATLHWTLTDEGRTAAMRFRKTSRAAETHDNAVIGVPNYSGAGTNSGAGAPHPAPAPVTLRDQQDRFTLDMFGPEQFALDAVREELDLAERLTAALAAGMDPPSLIDLPRRRRVGHIETLLDGWESATRNGPCHVCGVRTARPGYNPRSSLEGESVPSFTTDGRGVTRCDFCREYLAHPHRNPEQMKRRVLMSKAGLRSLNGSGAGLPFYAELTHLPSVPSGGVSEPWGYVPEDLTRAIVRALDLPRHCFIHGRHAQRDSLIHSFDNLKAPVWQEADLPPVRTHPPVYLEPSAKAKQADREWAAFQKRRAAEAEEWRKRRESTFELVDDGTGPTVDPRRRFLSDSARPLVTRR